jgi:NADH-quinone oxidoreductase subunit L
MLLEASFAAGSTVGHFAYWLGIAAAFMTAFYSWRLLFLTFHGKPRADKHTMAHVHESPLVMMAPLYVLAAGAVFAGWWGHDFFVGEHRLDFWGNSLSVLSGNDTVGEAEHDPEWVKSLPTLIGLGGILLAFIFYMKMTKLPGKIASAFRPLYNLSFNKWYFDELYNLIGVIPAFFVGKKLWKIGDGKIIDGLGPDGIAATIARSSRGASKLETGYVYHYAFAMLVGVVIFITAYIFMAQR